MTGRGFARVAAHVVLLLLIPASALADAIVVTRAMKASTIAEVFIGEDSIRVELEIGYDDIDAFRNLAPDPVYEQLGYDPEPLATRISRFPLEDWVMLADGVPLIGAVTAMRLRPRLERDEITGAPIPVPEDSAEVVLYAELSYPLPGRPSELSIRPPRGRQPANVGFVVYHHGIPVNDFRYLSMEVTAHLDWDDPFYSRFESRNLRRRYDAPLSVFLYIDHFEVRKEVVARPMDLQRWVDLGIAGLDTIPVDMQEELKARVVAFLTVNTPMTVNGRPVEPALDRIHFIRRTLRRTGVIDPPEPVALHEATLGVIFVASVDSLPDQATVAWPFFDERITYVPAVSTDEAGGLPTRLTPGDSILVWQNYLTNPSRPVLAAVDAPGGGSIPLPLISVVLVGVLLTGVITRRPRRHRAAILSVLLVAAVATLPLARVEVPVPFGSGVPSEAESGQVVGALLTNVYRSFDYRQEERIYDTLSRSASGDLLTRIYLETRQALELQSQGGARVKVKEVVIDAAVPEGLDGRRGFRATCSWQVAGNVGHWGHIHTRVNRYDAVITIEPVDGVWKITDIEVIEEKRVS